MVVGRTERAPPPEPLRAVPDDTPLAGEVERVEIWLDNENRWNWRGIDYLGVILDRTVARDVVLITHAHADHIGRLPELISSGFQGEIICSHPTKALIKPMMQDGLRLSGFNKAEAKKILQRIDDLSWGFECNKTFQLKKGMVTVRMENAGTDGYVILDAARFVPIPVSAPAR